MASVPGQIELTQPELKLLQSLIYQECGMFFDERRAHFLHDRLQRRMRACGLDTFYSYYRLLTSREGKAEFSGAAGKPHGQRNQLLSQPAATGSVSRKSCWKNPATQAGAAGLDAAPVERRMLHRPGAVHAGDADLRRPGLLLFAQSAAV